ncbi:guanine deaminase [Muribaculaceae bacterium Isolate-113 (HZI)]|uniref:guanine deaminase n=1 Tax=Sangeribacter muris TaxID=2880703 RepID=UPI000F49F481|nr:guanine deaminase [Sangeribacter muris]ROT22354.1 guanine deaminase [Muribaculaceae bacterium Isolate-114 (HZI)]ROT24331.1 guanine deaminase [Muribaculaceae bacterium Isolate-113 (HZI)]
MKKNISHIDADTQGAPLKGIRGEMVTFHEDPFLVEDESKCYSHYSDGLVVIQGDKILAAGDYMEVAAFYPDLKDIDRYDNAVIIPGMVDTHVHYVQSPMIGSFGDTLLQWLNQYTFPTEARFRSEEFSRSVARLFMGQILKQGTTTANVFSTTFPTSVDALFEESERYNTCMITGKVLQDRNLPEPLRDISAEGSVAMAEELLEKWHGRGRQLYAVIPRFAPTSTPRQLELAGDLYQKNVGKGVYMHTHLDEADDEIEWALSLYPEAANYTDIYRRYGLLGPRSVFAHCCLVKEEEWQTLHDYDCSVAHCPSSNLFLGDGMFKIWEAKDHKRPLRVGVGTDVGAGTNFSLPRQLNEAYKVSMLKKHSMGALKCFYMATKGGAQTLHLEDRIGSLAPGYTADITVLDMHPTEFLKWRMQFNDFILDRMFILQTLSPDNLVRATYVAGKRVYDREREQQLLYAADL